jgi:hypothetical protein
MKNPAKMFAGTIITNRINHLVIAFVVSFRQLSPCWLQSSGGWLQQQAAVNHLVSLCGEL